MVSTETRETSAGLIEVFRLKGFGLKKGLRVLEAHHRSCGRVLDVCVCWVCERSHVSERRTEIR